MKANNLARSAPRRSLLDAGPPVRQQLCNRRAYVICAAEPLPFVPVDVAQLHAIPDVASFDVRRQPRPATGTSRPYSLAACSSK